MEWLFLTVKGWAVCGILTVAATWAWRGYQRATKPKWSKKLNKLETQIASVEERIPKLQIQLVSLKRQRKAEFKRLNPW